MLHNIMLHVAGSADIGTSTHMLATSGLHVSAMFLPTRCHRQSAVLTHTRTYIQTDQYMRDATQTMCCTDVVLFAMHQMGLCMTLFPDAGL